MSIAGQKFTSGVGTHARSVIIVELGGGSSRFHAVCGVDDNARAGRGSVQFRIAGDGKLLWKSPVMKAGDKGQPIDLDVSGIKTLFLIAADTGDGVDFDHANWAEARFEIAGQQPKIVAAPVEEAVILTPPPPAEPRINGPKVYGCRPGNPFLYRIPTTGERPITLPPRICPPASRSTRPRASSPAISRLAESIRSRSGPPTLAAQHRGRLKIIAGDKLALTPPWAGTTGMPITTASPTR